MPSLRKSMRPSRTSTPNATPYDTRSPSSDSKKEKTQSSLDGWIEPPPKNPAPSFEEHGFARHGVLETMAPLGVPPSAKVKQRVRNFADPTARKAGFGRNGNILAGDEGVSTPEMTPAPELERDDSERQEEEEVPSFQARDEDEDDDWVPAKSKAKTQIAKTPTVRGKTPVQNKTTAHTRTPSKNGVNRPSSAVNSPARQGGPTLPSDIAMGTAKQRVTIAVNDAVTRAKSNNKPSLGVALRQLHEESKTDSYKCDVLESIIHQNSTPEQFAAFRHYIKDAKKRIKQEAKAREASVPKETPYVYSPPSFPISPLPDRVDDVVSPSRSGRGAVPSKATPRANLHLTDAIDITMDDAPPNQKDSTAGLKSAGVTAHPLATAPALAAKRSPSPHPPRMPSKSPRKHAQVNGDAAPDGETDGDVEASTNEATPTVKTPDSVVAAVSDSDLSDVNEEIVQNGPPEPLQADGNGAATVPGVKKGKPAALRAGKKSRANSVKPNGRWEKKPPPTAEDLAEEAELRRRREALAAEQPARMAYNPPTSELRYEDDRADTESLTESQIAVGPPSDTNQPYRKGRAPRNTISLNLGKRMREDNSALPSPQLESAPTTRPSTPAFAPPATKRLKLNNGQAARTKRSPVKNRDGPIAGIAHTGGGGSRQLGPDDNEPGSPPSESDDFCSACKGAGEFVCCDKCTRVYHFLCCDPPLNGPPDGSFLCHECDAKRRSAESPATESFNPFGPLLKQLESINTRSFALPSGIQTFYENVSARKDGSYHEEAKKFPLAKSSGYGYQRPDYLRTHDGDHKPILCVQCGKSSAGKRPMLKCDFCHAFWHLDCCDPPLANPPHISLEASQRDAWKCPRHVDHDLRSGFLLQNDLNDIGGDDVEMVDAEPLRVARKVRKPRQPLNVEPIFSRGLRNNGLIDVSNDPDDDTDGEGNYVFTPDDSSKDTNSKVFRVPEKGIIADFISKVKQNRNEHRREERRAAKAASRRKAAQQQFAARPIQQQQAALHLAQLANKEKDIGLTDNTVDALVLNLTVEAPKEVVTAISNSGPGPMTDAKRAELMKLKKLIERALNA